MTSNNNNKSDEPLTKYLAKNIPNKIIFNFSKISLYREKSLLVNGNNFSIQVLCEERILPYQIEISNILQIFSKI